MMTGKRIRERFGRKAALALAGAFLAGLFAGLAVTRWERAAPSPQSTTVGLSQSLDELDLTEAQRERIDRILATSQARTDAVLAEALPRLRAVVDSVDGEIRAVLTEEQRDRFGEIRRRPVVRRRVLVRDSIHLADSTSTP